MTAETASIDTCGNCRHHTVTDKARGGGVCRARAPVPLMMGITDTPLGPRPVTATFWPETATDTTACGDWRARRKDLAAIDFSRLETVAGEA